MKQPILNFILRWTTLQTRLNNAECPWTNHLLLTKLKLATAHDPRARSFIAELKTWNQLIDLVNEQEANLDGDSDEVRQAFAASMVFAASVPEQPEEPRQQPVYQRPRPHKKRLSTASYTESCLTTHRYNAKWLRSTSRRTHTILPQYDNFRHGRTGERGKDFS